MAMTTAQAVITMLGGLLGILAMAWRFVIQPATRWIRWQTEEARKGAEATKANTEQQNRVRVALENLGDAVQELSARIDQANHGRRGGWP